MLFKTRVDRHLRPTAVPAAVTALALSAATLVSLAALHLLSPQFDPSWRMVSEYALGRYGWLLSLMFAFWAASSWALAAALRPRLRTRRGRAGLAFLVLAARARRWRRRSTSPTAWRTASPGSLVWGACPSRQC